MYCHISHLYSYIRILLDYKCSTWYLTSVAKRFTALTFLSWTALVLVRIPLESYIFILIFSLPSRYEQVSRANVNEIEHGHSPVVIVVFDQRNDYSYKALNIYSRSIALKCWVIFFLLWNMMASCLKNSTFSFVLCSRKSRHYNI